MLKKILILEKIPHFIWLRIVLCIRLGFYRGSSFHLNKFSQKKILGLENP